MTENILKNIHEGISLLQEGSIIINNKNKNIS